MTSARYAEFRDAGLWTRLRRESARAWRDLRAPQGGQPVSPEYPEDFSSFTRSLWKRVSPFTMTSRERVAAIERAVRYIHSQGIEGDLVECGVAAGGSVMAMAYCLIELGDRDRRMWLYDTFSGMPAPTDRDVGRYGTKAEKRFRQRQSNGVSSWINIPEATVRQNIALTGYPEEAFTVVKGRVEETLRQKAPDKIAFLRLDTDWYESTKVEMEALFPRVSQGGVVLLDDYFAWRGHREAVDDYVDEHGVRIFWCRVDEHAVIGVKQ